MIKANEVKTLPLQEILNHFGLEPFSPSVFEDAVVNADTCSSDLCSHGRGLIPLQDAVENFLSVPGGCCDAEDIEYEPSVMMAYQTPYAKLGKITHSLSVLAANPFFLLMESSVWVDSWNDLWDSPLRSDGSGLTHEQAFNLRVKVIIAENTEVFKNAYFSMVRGVQASAALVDDYFKLGSLSGKLTGDFIQADETDMVYMQSLEKSFGDRTRELVGILFGYSELPGFIIIPKHTLTQTLSPTTINRFSRESEFFFLGNPVERPVDVSDVSPLTSAQKEIMRTLVEQMPLPDAVAAALAV